MVALLAFQLPGTNGCHLTRLTIQMTQSSALDFRPLVVASAALLAAWAQMGDLAAAGRHLRTLVEVSGAHDEDELFRCKTLLNAGFKTLVAPDTSLSSAYGGRSPAY